MGRSIYYKGLNKLISEGPTEFFYAASSYIRSRLILKIDKVAKSNHMIGVFLAFIFGILQREIIYKARYRYIRYTPFCNNMFDKRRYYFPDLKHHKQIERIRHYNAKYFNNEEVFIKPGDTVLEIGAARGVTTQIAARRGKRIIAFEPSPRGFECLQENIISEDIEIYQYAAWSEPDELEMKYGEQSGDDSLIEPNSGTVATSEKVRADTIENFSKELDIDKIDFLKVEAEGAEPEVIEGIGDVPVDRIVVNCSAERYGKSPLSEVSRALRQKGYSIRDSTENDQLFAKKKQQSDIE